MKIIALLSITLIAVLCEGESLPGTFSFKSFFLFLIAALPTCGFVGQLVLALN